MHPIFRQCKPVSCCSRVVKMLVQQRVPRLGSHAAFPFPSNSFIISKGRFLNPTGRLTGGSIRFQVVSIVLNNDHHLELDGTAG